MILEQPCTVGVKETLNRIAWTGPELHATSEALVEVEGEIHRRDCASAKGAVIRHMDLSRLLEVECGRCCIKTTDDLPGKAKNRLGRAVLRNASRILRAERALQDAPEPTGLEAAVQVLAAEAKRATAQDAVEDEGGTYTTSASTLRLLAELQDKETLNVKVTAARRLVEAEEEQLQQLCWEKALEKGDPPKRNVEHYVAAWLGYGNPYRSLRAASDPLVQATFLHYVKAEDAVAIVPVPVWCYWRKADEMVNQELPQGFFTTFDPSTTDPQVLQCLARDELAHGRFRPERIKELVELASVLR